MNVELSQDERYFLGSLINDYHDKTEEIDELEICEKIFDRLRLSCFLTQRSE